MAKKEKNIIARPDGKYQVRIRKKGIDLSETFTSMRSAKAWRDAQLAKIELNQHSVQKIDYINNIIDDYLHKITPRKRSQKVEHYTLERIKEGLGHLTSDNITAEHVVNYIDGRLQTVKPATVIKEIGKLSHVIDTANSLWGFAIVNPVPVARRVLGATRTLNIDEHRDRRLVGEEYVHLVNKDVTKKNRKLCDVIMFAIDTGMRRGEIINIKPEHKDGRLLTIPETKTDEARTIPLSLVASDILDFYDCSFYSNAGYLSSIFRDRCKLLSIKDLRFHDLRHEATSRFFEKGLSAEQVMIITGHKDYKSLARYTHIKPQNLLSKL